MAKGDDDNKRHGRDACPDCGAPMCGLPLVNEPEFECAKALADLVWERVFDGTERGHGVALMTAALLIKRGARGLGLPPDRGALATLAAIFTEQARAMILGRRERAAAASKAVN